MTWPITSAAGSEQAGGNLGPSGGRGPLRWPLPQLTYSNVVLQPGGAWGQYGEAGSPGFTAP